MIKESQYDLIERFFNGELNRNEQQEFEILMQQRDFNEAVQLQNTLRQQLEQQRTAHPYMQLFQREAQTYTVAPPIETFQPTRSQSNVGWWVWLQAVFQPIPNYAFSMAMVLLLFGGSFWWANSNYSNTAIIQDLHEPLLSNVLASKPSDKELLDKAKTAFFKGDFTRAERLLSNIELAENQYYYEAQSLLAYTYFKAKKFPKAIQQFDTLLQSYFQQLPIAYQDKNKLRWTRLLAYVGKGDTKSAFFQEELAYFLNSKSEIYSANAKNLQAKLQSSWRVLVFD